MNDGIHIRRALDEDLMGLAAITLDCVAGGASIGFMETLTLEQSAAFWQKCLESAGRSERIILVAQDEDSDVLVGTVQLVLAAPENQPHRADIAKLQVHRNVRGNGIASKLIMRLSARHGR